MKIQFKYAVKQGLTLRAAAFAVTLVINIVFGVMGYFRLWGRAGMVTAVTLSSIALCGVFAVGIIAGIGSFKDMFAAPEGYLHALTPVPIWKRLLAKTVTIVCEDYIALVAAICGVVLQGLIVSGEFGVDVDYSGYSHSPVGEIVSGMIVIFLAYAYFIMLLAFGAALKNSVFFGIPGRGWLAALSVAAAAWVFNLFNFILAPFGTVENWKFFFSISLPLGTYAGFAVYVVLLSVKTAALFAASSMLIERRNNL